MVAFVRIEGLFQARLSKSVPRTDVLAVIAAKDARANQVAKLSGNGASQFNREVGDTKARIHHIRGNDGFGGTGINTTVAGATVVPGFLVIFELQV